MRTRCAIVVSDNIATDLLYKLLRRAVLQPVCMVGVDPASEGLTMDRSRGMEATHESVDWSFERKPGVERIFEATSAWVHKQKAPRYEETGLQAIDLTPAKLGPLLVQPVNLTEVNLTEYVHASNVYVITCGGQATALHRVRSQVRCRIGPIRRRRFQGGIGVSGAANTTEHRRIHSDLSSRGRSAERRAFVEVPDQNVPVAEGVFAWVLRLLDRRGRSS